MCKPILAAALITAAISTSAVSAEKGSLIWEIRTATQASKDREACEKEVKTLFQVDYGAWKKKTNRNHDYCRDEWAKALRAIFVK